jgi:RNA polymerase sigma factor (sigma-70 family)
MAAPTAALGRIPARPPRAEAARFASVYERHHQALYRYCRSILRHDEDAQDALQSAMTRAFAALQTERRELEMRPWLFRIAHNEAVSILRRRTTTCALDEDLGDVGALEDRVFEREALRLLRADLAELTERQRWALVLRELNGLTHEEIATVLDTSPAAVKQAIFEARSALLRCREGRDTACRDIRGLLSDGDGRVLRGRRVRAHLQTCSACRAFRDDLRRRPRELAALAPPLPAGAAAAVLRWIAGGSGSAGALGAGSAAVGGGLAAKAAVAVVIAGGAVALHHARPAVTPARHEPVHTAVPSATAGAKPATRPVAFRRGDAATHAPARGATRTTAPSNEAAVSPAPSGRARNGPGSATPPDRAETPPGHARRDDGGAPGQSTAAPGQAKEQATPPGQTKTPPGQAKKDTRATTPPGQVKPPPGQAKKQPGATGQTNTPLAQAKKQPAAAVPPGQAKKQAAATVPPSAPPGQAGRPAEATAPPQQAHGHPMAPGQAAAATPAAPAAASAPPGQAHQAPAAAPDPAAAPLPPGQAKKAG